MTHFRAIRYKEKRSLYIGIKNKLSRCFAALFPESIKTIYLLAGLLTCSVFECLPIRVADSGL